MGIIKYRDFEKIYENYQDEWSVTIDVSNAWSSMEAGRTTPADFIKEYINALSSKRDDIVQSKGASVWNKLAEKMNKLQDNLTKGKLENKDIHPLYDQIYDWADENDVLIKA